MGLVVTGIVIGVAGAVALARTFASLLYGVSAADPVTLAGVAMPLIFAALVGVLHPRQAGDARRPGDRTPL